VLCFSNFRCLFWLPIIVTGVLLPASRLPGDTVELKTGEHVEGAFRQADTSNVVIIVAGRSTSIPFAQVEAIRFSSQKVSSLGAESLDSVQALRSVVKSGVAYRDFAPRVLDARVKVDRYLNSPESPGEANLRASVSAAIRYYELASNLWNASIVGSAKSEAEYASVGLELQTNLRISGCKGTRDILDVIKLSGHGDTSNLQVFASAIGSLGEQLRSALVSCAAAKVSEAEKLKD
jgi:hypothetical protein